MTHPSTRGTLFLEQAEVLAQRAFPADQYLLRLAAPETARRARPGQFVHLTCDPLLPLRRPLSLLAADPASGWIEILYKVVGRGTRLLGQRRPGDRLSLLGPIGRPFQPRPERRRPLLIGGGVGMPPVIFLAHRLHGQAGCKPLVVLGSEVPFPLDPAPATTASAGIPAEADWSLPLLDEGGIPCRLASASGLPGCFPGHVTDLAAHWLAGLAAAERDQVEIFACGPEPMLEASARLAARWRLPAQLSLEEYMACGLGGCAGCTVAVHGAGGPRMERVCVDGPVFPAEAIYPQCFDSG